MLWSSADKTADYYTAHQLKPYFYRPDIVERAIVLGGAKEAVAHARDADPDRMRFDMQSLLNRQPPSISIEPPHDRARIMTGTAQMAVDIGETPDPVSSFEVFVNGVGQ